MKLGSLLQNIDILETSADLGLEVTGIESDSSKVRRGDVFVAITGFKTDGHKYIDDAIKRGAACVICQRKPESEISYIIVKDSRIAMALISSAWFGNPASKLKIIGVTGTNGKTSVTYVIRHIIENITRSKVGLIGTIGNFIGGRELETTLTTPDSHQLHSLFDKMVFEGCKYAVMEVSSHALSLHRVHGITFDIGIFTNLTPEHMDFHTTMDEYAKAKAILFSNSKKSIINTDDEYAQIMIDSSTGEVLRYGKNTEKTDITVENIELFPDRAEFDINDKTETNHIRFGVPGMFSVYNAMASYAAGILLGFEQSEIAKAIGSFEGVNGRAEVLRLGKDFTVMVDYAHTPDALKNIIRTARSITDGRVITLFGCGGDRDKEKRPQMGRIAQELSDVAIITSDNPRTENPRVIIDDILKGITDVTDSNAEGSIIMIENRREAIYKALEILQARDVLIIAGKGHETYQIVGKDKTQFDDREVVNDYFRKIKNRKRELKLNA